MRIPSDLINIQSSAKYIFRYVQSAHVYIYIYIYIYVLSFKKNEFISFRITFYKEKKQANLLPKIKVFVLRRGYTVKYFCQTIS